MATNWRIRLFLLSFVILLLAGFGSSWAVLYAVRRNVAETFHPHMPEYLAPAKAGGDGGPVKGKMVVAAGDGGPVKGKMVVVDKASQDLDWDVFFDLPDDLRAATPEEVRTAVWLEYGREQDARFAYGPNHLPAFRQTCTVTVIDQAGRNVIATTSLQGGDPPDSIDENAQEGLGPKPTKEVVAYLKGLPRQ